MNNSSNSAQHSKRQQSKTTSTQQQKIAALIGERNPQSQSQSPLASSSLQQIISNDNKQQLQPLKTIFLNKYEQLKVSNPSNSAITTSPLPSPSNNVDSSNRSDNNNTTTNSTVILGALLVDPPQQNQQSGAHLTNTNANNYHHHHHLHHTHPHNQLTTNPLIQPSFTNPFEQHTNETYHHQTYQKTEPSIKNPSKSSKMPSSSSKSATPNTAPSTSGLSSGGGGMKRHLSGSNSSLQNSDEDEDYGDEAASTLGGYNYPKSKEEKRRLSHTAAEQKRRNAIKRGYDDLQTIVPSCDYMDPSSSQKVCKATVLKRCYELLQNVVPSCQPTDPIISTRITRATTLEQTIDYIHELQKEKDKHEQELDSLKKEITALKIMRQNYEEMLQYHRNQPKDNPTEINDDAKFDLFVKYSDNLFHSFQSMLNPTSFGNLSGSLFNWLEQAFSVNNLKSIVYLSLIQAAQQVFQ